ncbi:hypothetical protein AX15_004053 [Amanita polypyramis BW_CC]|nr:hypothetical protein AX15_004053 [Amanita polypyramis BW_CC]
MAFSMSKGELIGTYLELLGFGIYLVVGPRAFLTLRQKQLDKARRIYLSSTAIITFLLVTSHLIIDLVRAFTAFTAHTDIPNASELYFVKLSAPSTVVKNLTVVLTTLVADILLIYRTLAVWDHRWRVLILPAALYCLDVATAILFMLSLARSKNDCSVVDSAAFARLTYFFAATLAVNFVCTCLIAYRIWVIQNAVARYTSGDRRVRNAFSIILESAAIYTVDLVCMISLVSAHNAALFILLNSMPPLIGLVFTSIILRSSSDTYHYNDDMTGSEMQNNNIPSLPPDNEIFKMK